MQQPFVAGIYDPCTRAQYCALPSTASQAFVNKRGFHGNCIVSKRLATTQHVQNIIPYLISSANITPFFYSIFRYTQELPDVVSPIVTARARYHNRDLLLEHQHRHNTGCHTGTHENQADTVRNFNTWLDLSLIHI